MADLLAANASTSEASLTSLNVDYSHVEVIDIDEDLKKNWFFILLSVVPITCVFGNCLVIAAVWTTKSLQTPTNYLLVSLACADLLVGILVMPFSIYTSINGLHWHLPGIVCYVYCLFDVSASTSSIMHLVLISIDRLVAATRPAEYKTLKHRRRVYIAIGFTWVFSICLSLPLVTGFDTKTRFFLLTEHHCGIYSPVYMFCSSIFAFYLPCIIMCFTYGYIFYALKKRLRTIQLQEMAGGQFLGFGADVGNIMTSAVETVIGVKAKDRYMISWEKPLLKKIEETAAEHASSLNDSEREQLQTILEFAGPSSSGSQELTTMEDETDRPPSVLLEAVTLKPPCDFVSSNSSTAILEVPSLMSKCNSPGAGRRFSDAIHSKLHMGRKKSLAVGGINAKSLRRHSYQPQGCIMKEDRNRLNPNQKGKAMRRLSEIITDWERPSRPSLGQMYSYARRESVYIARKKLAGLKDWALDLLAKLKSKQGMAIRRETRATKLVATVMAVFLVCWLPFFTLNMVKVYKLVASSWPVEMEVLFHWFTFLGYINSSLNFFIYSVINKKFRSSFRRLMGLTRRSHRDKTWMLPPKYQARRHHNKYACGCGPFQKVKKTTLRKASSAGLIARRFSVNKPEIIIDEVSLVPSNNFSISAGGNTTYRRSSDDCIRRSSSEVIGGVVFPSNYNSRRGSGMSNSSASLQLHDMHQIAAQSNEGEIFV